MVIVFGLLAYTHDGRVGESELLTGPQILILVVRVRLVIDPVRSLCDRVGLNFKTHDPVVTLDRRVHLDDNVEVVVDRDFS